MGLTKKKSGKFADSELNPATGRMGGEEDRGENKRPRPTTSWGANRHRMTANRNT